jgi:hypothetical protein
LCQEQIVQWKKKLNELQENEIDLVLVSIGLPEKGKLLLDHLEFPNGDDYLLVDPENVLYDALDLNRGVQRTFFNPATPLAFLDRLQQGNGLEDLLYVLSKWKDAFFIPPKQAQALLQGGAFVFDGPKTVYAHYDPSTAAHAKLERVLEIAKATNASRLIRGAK